MNTRYLLLTIYLIITVTRTLEISQELEEQISPAIPHNDSSYSKTLFSSHDNIQQSIIEAINKLPTNGYLGLEARWLTDQAIIDALKIAHQRGVFVELFLDTREKKNKLLAKEFKELGIQVKQASNIHAKTFFMSSKKPKSQLDDLPDCTTFTGSANPSNLACHNKEIMIQDPSQEIFKQLWEYHHQPTTYSDTKETGSPVEKKPLKLASKDIVDDTPIKSTIYSSQSHVLGTSKARRIRKAARQSRNNIVEIHVASMSFNDQDIIKELMTAATNNATIRIIVDGSALYTLKTYQALYALYQAGAHVLIFNPKGTKKAFKRYPIKAHMKVLLRRINNDYLTIISTGNLTKESNKESNFDAYYPDNKKLFDSIKLELDVLEKECVDFGQILAHDTYQPAPNLSVPRKRPYLPAKTTSAKRLRFDT